MIAAIYARKSTDQGTTPDEERSVTRQVEHARAYAEAKGWQVDGACIYVDDGVSGAEFANRPAFVRMMNALTPRPPFQRLVVMDESRLGREQVETSYALKQLMQAGVEVWCYLENRQRTLDSPTDKIMLSLAAFADELEREKARQRTADALQRKARKGYVCGGRVFGYDNVEVLGPDGTRSHVERQVNDDEAAVVRRIFELAAGGMGKTRIAHQLNDEGLPSPSAQQGRPKGWAPSSVGTVLHRELYRGWVVYNTTRKRDAWGQRKGRPKLRPSSEHIRVELPELRIVDEELWTAVQARLEAARKTYLRHQNGKIWGRPPGGASGKYLLTGQARCAECGAGLEVVSRSHGKRRAYFYTCSAARRKGRAICDCGNSMQIPMAAADEAVVAALVEGVLTPNVLKRVALAAVEKIEEQRETGERERVAKQLSQTERAIERLTDAVVAGGDVPSLVGVIKTQEERRKTLAARLEALEAPPVTFDAAMEAAIEQAIDEWRGTLDQEAPLARQIVSKLLTDKLAFRPEERDGEQGWAFEGEATIEKLVEGVVPRPVPTVVSPTGFEPVLPA